MVAMIRAVPGWSQEPESLSVSSFTAFPCASGRGWFQKGAACALRFLNHGFTVCSRYERWIKALNLVYWTLPSLSRCSVYGEDTGCMSVSTCCCKGPSQTYCFNQPWARLMGRRLSKVLLMTTGYGVCVWSGGLGTGLVEFVSLPSSHCQVFQSDHCCHSSSFSHPIPLASLF